MSSPLAAAQVRERLRSLSEVTVYDTERFSWKSQAYWLSTTKAGLGVGFVAFLSLLIGAIVTSQTLYAATVTSIKELALLRALGAPRSRMRVFVVQQSFLVGIFWDRTRAARDVCPGPPGSGRWVLIRSCPRGYYRPRSRLRCQWPWCPGCSHSVRCAK